MKTMTIGLALAALVAPLATAHPKTPADPNEALAAQVKKRLLGLPDYGVYDYLSFEIAEGKIVLTGYTLTPGLRSGAEKALARLKAGEQVENDIQVLPLSTNDDLVRNTAFFRLYGSRAFQRYVSGGQLMPGDPFLRPPLGWANTPANTFEPGGNYPVHIIVRNGNVDLEGVVDNAADRDIAAIIVSGTPGAFSVTNHIVVAR